MKAAQLLTPADLAALDAAAVVLRKLARASGADHATLRSFGGGVVVAFADHDGAQVWFTSGACLANTCDVGEKVGRVELTPGAARSGRGGGG